MVDKALDFAKFVFDFSFDGHPIGTAPHEVIFRQNKSALRYFEPAERKSEPLFVSMPLINKWGVFDLLPEKSVVRALTAAGIPVYLLDWGTPEAEDAAVGMEELLDGVLHRAIDRARRHAAKRWGTSTLDALGYCVGGTFLAAYCGLHPDAFRKVALLCAPIDFRHAGRLGTWADPKSFPVDAVIDNHGNFPGELMGQSFTWLKVETTPQKWRSLWERFEQPGFKDTWAALESWNGDNIDFWGEAYRSYIKRCYFENSFFAGGWPVGGRKADLGAVKAPLTVLAADKDHICPTPAAFGAKDVWGGPTTCVELKGGHVGVCLSKKLTDALVAWSTGPVA